MHGRIKELYLQAHSTRYYDGDPALDGNPPTVYWQGEVSAQRFAELIVRECAETIQDFVDHRFPASEYPNRLKQYFGVEE